MKLVWHIVKKDIRRLQVPLAIWTLLLIAEVVLYLSVGGVFGAPDQGWLSRLSEPAEMFARMFLPFAVVYLLMGWLVYGDPLVAPDPFWITRPISGRQLFAAKLLGGVVMFVLPPVLINMPWWLASGFGPNEILSSAGAMAGVFAVPVAVGLGMASVTDSFQRYILWSVVAFALYVVFSGVFSNVIFAFRTPVPIANDSGLARGLLGASLLALALAAHQFLTRRLARSIGLAFIGTAATGLALAAWTLVRPVPLTSPEPADLAKMQLAIAGPGRVSRGIRASNMISLRLRAEDLPDDAAVLQTNLQGEWRQEDALVWSTHARQTNSDMLRAATRSLLGLPPRAGPAGETDRVIRASLPIAAASLQQITERPTTFQAVADLTVRRGKVLAEMPLRNSTVRTEGRAFSISNLDIIPLNETARKRSVGMGEANDGHAISLLLTERLADEQRLGFEIWRWRMEPTVYALVRRGTGEIIFSDPVSTGPTGLCQLNRVTAHSMLMRFVPPTTNGWINEASLVVIRFKDPQTLRRSVAANPLAVEVSDAPRRRAQ